MKKWLCLLLAICSSVMFGCKNTGQTESSMRSNQGEESNVSDVSDVGADGVQTRFETTDCAMFPIQMAIDLEQMEFDINNVEITLSYGYHFQRNTVDTEWKDEERRFFAGTAIIGPDFKSLYLEKYPHEERTVFSLFEKVEVGEHDNRLYLLNKITYEQKNSWDYLYTKTENGIVYGHSKQVKIPASMFTDGTGYLLFYIWECSLWNEEYIDQNTEEIKTEQEILVDTSPTSMIKFLNGTPLNRELSYFLTSGLLMVYEKQGNTITILEVLGL